MAKLYYRKRLLNYKNKVVLLQLDEPIRKGQCQQCKKKIGDTYINYKGKEKIIKETHTHHYSEYNDNNMLKNTIELCAHCHGQESAKKRYKDHDDLSKRLCVKCNQNRNKDWFKVEGGYLCKNCYEVKRRRNKRLSITLA